MTQDELSEILEAHREWLLDLEAHSQAPSIHQLSASYHRHWRSDKRRADLEGADLRGLDLSDVDLSHAKMTSANLSGCSLRGSILRGANLSEACLLEADLSQSNLSGSILRGANLSRSSMLGAYLIDADLRAASMLEADMRGADLRSASMREADLRGADLSDANLTSLTEIITLCYQRRQAVYHKSNPGMEWGLLQIGCENHSLKHWFLNYKAIGEKNNYTTKQIKVYGKFIEMLMDDLFFDLGEDYKRGCSIQDEGTKQ